MHSCWIMEMEIIQVSGYWNTSWKFINILLYLCLFWNSFITVCINYASSPYSTFLKISDLFSRNEIWARVKIQLKWKQKYYFLLDRIKVFDVLIIPTDLKTTFTFYCASLFDLIYCVVTSVPALHKKAHVWYRSTTSKSAKPK